VSAPGGAGWITPGRRRGTGPSAAPGQSGPPGSGRGDDGPTGGVPGRLASWRRARGLCGACVGTCPSDLITEEWKGYKILVGGKIGKHPKLGVELTDAKSPQEAVAIFRKIINWAKQNTKTGERLGACLDRVGFEKFKKEVLSK